MKVDYSESDFWMWVVVNVRLLLLVLLLVVIIIVGVGYWGWRILNWVWLTPKKLDKFLREQGFQGNPYRLFHGDLKDREAMRIQANSSPINFSHHISPRVLPSIHHTIIKYGKKSFMWLGPYPRLIILDPNQLRSTFSIDNDVRKQTLNPWINLLIDGLVNHEGSKWSKHRKIINPAFHLDKLKDMVPAFFQSCCEMIRKWEEKMVMVSESEEQGQGQVVAPMCELDVMPYLQTLASDVISRTAFGSSYEEGKRIFQLQKELANLVIDTTFRLYIPGWRFLPTKLNKRMKEVAKESDSLLLGIINKRQKAMEAGEEPNNDLLGILLESNLNEIRQYGNNKDVGLSIQDVIGECKIFYLAGQETTATLLIWTMILLGSHPEWQEEARAEVIKVFGNKEPNFDGLSRLKVVTMILNEALRLYPPAPLLSRRFDKETRVGDSIIPAGVMISFPTVEIHRDREVWGEDALEFKPERFSEGISKATKNGTLAFFPFGWGPRICIGQNFSMIESKIALVAILRSFSFQLSPSYTHAPIALVTLQPQHGAHIILRKLLH